MESEEASMAAPSAKPSATGSSRDPEQQLKQFQRTAGSGYSHAKACKHAAKAMDVELLVYLRDVVKVDLETVQIKAGKFATRKTVPLLQYAEKKRLEPVIDYLKQCKREGGAKMYEYVTETDE